MKHLRALLFSLLALLFVFSCEEEDEPAPENYFVANKDGVKWEAEKVPVIGLREGENYNIEDSLHIAGFRADGRIHLSVAFTGVGTYKLPNKGVARYYEMVGGDVFMSAYPLDESDENAEVVITEWNPDTKTLRGTFQFVGKKIDANGNLTSEILPFTQGEFHGKVSNLD
ncbi:DUF6252 family protein [Rufibacter sp. XAAS-G3-1]|uniref:DUF6252 family protein n=1 Tax=Rufibacter sp. XAAS-G3-1 TaxID=2729134 RepID=UPI0015E7DBC9|nr:DUF6252 family protein [Rufibacter sp. XAAS-G3-1]